MEFKIVELSLEQEKILIRNLTRPQVDALFKQKNDILDKISSLKLSIEYSDNEVHIKGMQNKINKLIPLQQEYDTAAREKWRKILEFTNNLN